MIVRNKYSGDEFSTLKDTNLKDAEKILSKSREAFELMRRMPSYKKYDGLYEVSRIIDRKSEDFARTIAIESGKPIKHARSETKRASLIMRLSAEEAGRIHGETVPVDVDPEGVNRFSYYTRVPVGTIFSITPFNDPLILVAQRAGPALAAGNSIVNKPSSLSPLSSAMLMEVSGEAGLPEGAISTVIAQGGNKVTDYFLRADGIRLISFIGGYEAAGRLSAKAGLKRVFMELGNNTPVIVWNDADLDQAAELVVKAAFENQGQYSLHPQRIIVKEDVYEYFQNRLIEITSNLVIGDPLNPVTDVGPMISEEEAKRVEKMIGEAMEGGATILSGGSREGSFIYPTILGEPDVRSGAWRTEIFGPVISLKSVTSMEEAINLANDTPNGLQADVFTSDMDLAFTAVDRLDFASVLINDASSFMGDTMPFGGFKKSGFGRGGIKYAVDEMTETKLAMFKR